jgi:hypothetical protein
MYIKVINLYKKHDMYQLYGKYTTIDINKLRNVAFFGVILEYY